MKKRTFWMTTRFVIGAPVLFVGVVLMHVGLWIQGEDL